MLLHKHFHPNMICMRNEAGKNSPLFYASFTACKTTQHFESVGHITFVEEIRTCRSRKLNENYIHT